MHLESKKDDARTYPPSITPKRPLTYWEDTKFEPRDTVDEFGHTRVDGKMGVLWTALGVSGVRSLERTELQISDTRRIVGLPPGAFTVYALMIGDSFRGRLIA